MMQDVCLTYRKIETPNTGEYDVDISVQTTANRRENPNFARASQFSQEFSGRTHKNLHKFLDDVVIFIETRSEYQPTARTGVPITDEHLRTQPQGPFGVAYGNEAYWPKEGETDPKAEEEKVKLRNLRAHDVLLRLIAEFAQQNGFV